MNNMTQQEIQERNKQIALMLGWKEATLEYKLKWCSVPTEERLNRLKQEYVPILMKENQDPLWNSSLLWHSDWNWLMESKKFICNLKEVDEFSTRYDSFEKEYYCSILPSYKYSFNTLYTKVLEEEIQAVFIIISNFAKLYNEKKI